ncbi:hypothetical protein VIC_003710 [Vibrio coralliilyticus ATCC BAA-450]|nr:hypothetical protein VIC_003710 [Vibrio coralliilyticus ATCC BAA-450]
MWLESTLRCSKHFINNNARKMGGILRFMFHFCARPACQR